MTCRKTLDGAAGATSPPRFDWSSRLGGGVMKSAFPVRVLQTGEGELYVFVNSHRTAGPRVEQKSWARLIGPLDSGKPLKGQLEGIGPWMKVEQAGDETRKVVESWDSKAGGEGAFVASVDLSDLLKNEAGALAAIKSRDRKALETACPNPYRIRA